MDAPKGTIVAYATSPGSVAADGAGRNGIYTKHLLKNIRKSDLSVQDVFMETGLGVMVETNEQQVPWVSSTPVQKYYLAGKDSSSPDKEKQRLAEEREKLERDRRELEEMKALAEERKRLEEERKRLEAEKQLEDEHRRLKDEKQKLASVPDLREKHRNTYLTIRAKNLSRGKFEVHFLRVELDGKEVFLNDNPQLQYGEYIKVFEREVSPGQHNVYVFYSEAFKYLGGLLSGSKGGRNQFYFELEPGKKYLLYLQLVKPNKSGISISLKQED